VNAINSRKIIEHEIVFLFFSPSNKKLTPPTPIDNVLTCYDNDPIACKDHPPGGEQKLL
jgi:hypothetical protein